MIRNDYRRALILLRSAVKGMSGHVRLERRTLGGSVRFSVSGAGTNDDLRALILRRGKGGWTAVPVGALRVDNRGQAGLTWAFDPRNIDGHALEDYPVIAVVRLGRNGAVEPAMSGFVGGTTEVDWAQAMASARALYRNPAQTAEEAREAPVRTEAPEETAAEAPEEAATEAPAEGEEPVGGLPEAEEGAAARTPEAGEEGEAGETPAPEDGAEQPAGDGLALDIAVPWPEAVEPLRALFQQLPACQPFAADGYTFVCAPLPGSGQAHSLVGVRVEDERPVAVCYGIPGIFAPEPPAGLDGYMWRGSGASGWWVTFIDALTGEETGA